MLTGRLDTGFSADEDSPLLPSRTAHEADKASPGGRHLRDRYHLGYITHKGVEYKGRHEPLISQELYNKVQEVLDGQRGGGWYAGSAITHCSIVHCHLMTGGSP